MAKKILLVLGGSSDIGISLIGKIHKDFDVIIAQYCNNNAGLETLLSQLELAGKLMCYQVNFLDTEAVSTFINKLIGDEFIPTHIVYLPALKVVNQKFHKIEMETFESDFALQISSTATILKAFLPYMSKKQYGKIVFMLTSYVVGKPPKYCSSYIVSKYALLGLMKALAAEYAEKFININAISPSMVETKFIENVSHIVVEKSAYDNPMKRNALTDDITPVIRMLLSDECNYITGENIVISGGSVIE